MKSKTPIKDTEIRKFTFEIRADHDEQHGDFIAGRPIVYDSITDMYGEFAEVIDRGSLDDSDLKDVKFLVNHDTNMIPLARSRNNNVNSTMQMSIDNNGMAIRVNLDTENNSDAKNLYSAIKRGDIDGMSFMFTVEKSEWEALDSDYPTRHIKKIGKVFEVSAVTFPAYADTTIFARSKATLESERSKALESAKETELESLKQEIRNKIKKGV